MPPKDAAAQGAPGGGGRGVDRLSGLRDETLFRVMAHLKAWEAVRTCVLSTRWRKLWASAGHLDIRQPCLCAGRGVLPAARLERREVKFSVFVKTLLLRRRPLVPLESLRLCWSHETVHGGANIWVAHAVRRGAVEIELSGKHHNKYPSPECMNFIARDSDTVTIRLKILKLIHIRLDGTTLTQLCSRCTCLEELELKDCQILEAPEIRSTMLKCLTMIRCQIRKGLSVHAPNLVALQFSRNFWHVPWIQNLGLLAASNIYLQAPHKYNIYLQAPHKYTECSDLSSCNLKILKLSCVKLDDTTLEQLYSRCTSLEELELIDCSVVGKKIQSTSLRCLTMIDCKFAIGSWVNVPNLLSLRCTRPFQQVPCFWNMKFLVTAIIALDDSCIPSDSWWTWADDHKDESDHDGDFFAHSRAEDSDDNGEFFDNESNHFFEYSGAEDSDDNGEFFEHSGAEDSDVNSDNESDPNEEDESGIDGAHSGAEESDDNIDVGIEKSGDDNDDESYLNDNTFAHAGAEDSDENHGSGPGDEVDGCTVRYDEIAEEYNGDCGGMFGGYGMLCSLSNVRKMALSAHSGEVLLMRESKLCPDFKNLKTLSLGEWCITPDFDILARVLQSSPNLENLFVHLDMANKSRVDFDKRASLFVSTNLKKVEITCCKHNKMVDILAELFRVNIVTNKKVFVHHTACTCDVNRGTGSQAKRKAQTEAKKRPVKQIRPGN
ncbi:hypothetical protein SEVIR_6G028700v4 [Setaria viridis]|uniref:F-box domain-containing protein n=3 Tax=Setaria TaxID=4554 RepID=A0A368RHJ1_SETIT|nr:uncharacterized protein LOC101764507 [Setaria italica]RCV29675.1 hypothetical protein SETIT_6G031100v2 [Setaria italica]TKW08456.1 hypothetical protein SEVIR_6G028700v2 [Setaria viridis]